MSPRRPIRHPALGAALRRARETYGVSGNELAKRLGWNQAKVSLLESGRQTPSEDDIIAWAIETGTDSAALLDAREQALVRRLDIRAAARRPGGVEALQGDLESLEAGSTSITEYQPMLIPGLAQVPAYTREWLSQPARVELGGQIDVEQIVARRGERQRRLQGRKIVVAIEATALAVVYGTVETQREQLDQLAEAADSGALDLVVVQRPVAILHGFELLDDAAIVETVAGAHVMSDPQVVGAFRMAMQSIRSHGLAGRQALAEVRRVRAALV